MAPGPILISHMLIDLSTYLKQMWVQSGKTRNLLNPIVFEQHEERSSAFVDVEQEACDNDKDEKCDDSDSHNGGNDPENINNDKFCKWQKLQDSED